MASARAKPRTRPENLDSLIDEARDGNPAAREMLASWCLTRVRRTVLFTCGPQPDADDLVQSIVARIFDRLDQYRPGSRFGVWVDRVAINQVRDHFRRTARTRLLAFDDDLAAHHPGQAERPDERSSRTELAVRLAEALAELTPNQRLPLVLRHLHGYTVPEIAAMLDLSFEAAKKRLHRGRRTLFERLRDDPLCADFLRWGAP